MVTWEGDIFESSPYTSCTTGDKLLWCFGRKVLVSLVKRGMDDVFDLDVAYDGIRRSAFFLNNRCLIDEVETLGCLLRHVDAGPRC